VNDDFAHPSIENLFTAINYFFLSFTIFGPTTTLELKTPIVRPARVVKRGLRNGVPLRSKKRSPRIFDCVWPRNAPRHFLEAQEQRSPAFPLSLTTAANVGYIQSNCWVGQMYCGSRSPNQNFGWAMAHQDHPAPPPPHDV